MDTCSQHCCKIFLHMCYQQSSDNISIKLKTGSDLAISHLRAFSHSNLVFSHRGFWNLCMDLWSPITSQNSLIAPCTMFKKQPKTMQHFKNSKGMSQNGQKDRRRICTVHSTKLVAKQLGNGNCRLAFMMFAAKSKLCQGFDSRLDGTEIKWAHGGNN